MNSPLQGAADIIHTSPAPALVVPVPGVQK